MTKQQTHASMAEQALRIMDSDGEAAMWHFAKQSTRKTSPPPLTAVLTDGSSIHLVNGAYTFQNTPLQLAHRWEQRSSYLNPQDVPAEFKPQTPLSLWPNQETLFNRVLEHLIDQAAEELDDEAQSEAPRAPEPKDLSNAVEKVRQAIRDLTPSVLPSVDTIDHLGSEMDALVTNVLRKVPAAARAPIIQQAKQLLPSGQEDATAHLLTIC